MFFRYAKIILIESTTDTLTHYKKITIKRDLNKENANKCLNALRHLLAILFKQMIGLFGQSHKSNLECLFTLFMNHPQETTLI